MGMHKAAEMQVPEGYKKTELGVIPEEWRVTDLGSVASFLKGVGLPKSQLADNGKFDCIHYGQLFTSYGPKIDLLLSKTDFNGPVRSRVADILMPTSDVTPTGLATASSIMHDGVVLGGDILIIRPEPKRLYGVFFAYLIPLMREQVMRLVTGTTVYHLYGREMATFVFPKPNVEEQTVIANALSDVDALIAEQVKLIAKKQAIKTATMQQLLNGKTRLPQFAHHPDGSAKGYKASELGEVPEDWKLAELGSIASFIKGAGLPKSQLADAGQFGCIHYGQLFSSYGPKIDALLSKTDFNGPVRSKTNDILMPTSDVTPTGLATASSIVIDDVVLGGDILVIRPDKEVLNGIFFAYLVPLMREQVMRLVTGTTVYHLYGRDMAKFVFHMPGYEEQSAIATILTDIDSEIEALQQRLTKTRQIKQGMLQELLTGKTRLPFTDTAA